MFEREEIIEKLVGAFRADERVLAMWEGGSAAFGNVDGLSDIDLVLLVVDGAGAEMLDELQRVLEGMGELDWIADYPTPNWHGNPQRFLHLKDSSEHLAIDVCAIERLKENWFLDPGRHGRPRVLFDREGLLAGNFSEEKEVSERRVKRLKEIADFLPLHISCVEKEIARGKSLDAIGFYNGLILRPLNELLGMRHRPARFDFGLRYWQGVLPAGDMARLERLAYPGSLEGLADCLADAVDWTRELLADLNG